MPDRFIGAQDRGKEPLGFFPADEPALHSMADEVG
jgi:hypothetical protein